MSQRLAGLLDARVINQYFGTAYTVEQLSAWRDVEITEALTYAQMMTERDAKHD